MRFAIEENKKRERKGERENKREIGE